MKERKFKVWHKRKERFLKSTECCLMRNGNVAMIENGNLIATYPQVNIDILQFTGIKDDNGKPIYEGDILKCTDEMGSWTTEVEFKDAGFLIELSGFEYDSTVIGWAYHTGICDMEIIGNIWENPELLVKED